MTHSAHQGKTPFAFFPNITYKHVSFDDIRHFSNIECILEANATGQDAYESDLAKFTPSFMQFYDQS